MEILKRLYLWFIATGWEYKLPQGSNPFDFFCCVPRNGYRNNLGYNRTKFHLSMFITVNKEVCRFLPEALQNQGKKVWQIFIDVRFKKRSARYLIFLSGKEGKGGGVRGRAKINCFYSPFSAATRCIKVSSASLSLKKSFNKESMSGGP